MIEFYIFRVRFQRRMIIERIVIVAQTMERVVKIVLAMHQVDRVIDVCREDEIGFMDFSALEAAGVIGPERNREDPLG